MSNFIRNITIENFKSIKKLEMKDCARINLIIGKPNVGKSNIIEALSVFSLPYSTNLFYQFRNHIRLENETELFYDGDSTNPSVIDSGIEKAIISLNRETGLEINISKEDGSNCSLSVTDKFVIKKKSSTYDFQSRIKRYTFRSGIKSIYVSRRLFMPPFGVNIFDILLSETKIRKEIEALFYEYGLKLVLDKASKSLKILKESGSDVFLLPYTSIADTLQRVIFFKIAIETNTNSVLIFEEPEAHAFPPYIAKITQEVIASESNQFFITTHSPYVLNDFLEREDPELAIYLANYRDHETIVKRLTESEQNEVYKYGIDVFFNNEYFWD